MSSASLKVWSEQIYIVSSVAEVRLIVEGIQQGT